MNLPGGWELFLVLVLTLVLVGFVIWKIVPRR